MIERLTIVSGEKHSGKTTWLQTLVRLHTDIGGILMPQRNGRRYFKNIITGELWLAEAVPAETETFSVGRFLFSKSAFDKANGVMVDAVNRGIRSIILDEIGPLEIDFNTGLYPSFHFCLHHPQLIENLILVARCSLYEQVKKKCEGFYRSLQLIDFNKEVIGTGLQLDERPPHIFKH